jgi:hypothetical protein
MAVSTRRRVERLVRSGSPRVVARAAWRELVVRRHEAAVERAAREGRPLLCGPFLGEVGYELLYWIPFLRRLVRELGVERDRVTVITRGGADVWYCDFAAHAVDLLELVPPERYLDELVGRRRREGHAKQLRVDPLDERLAASAGKEDAALVHPLLMYGRLRFLWEGLQPASDAPSLVDYRPLDPVAFELPADAPREYVAVKLYFSEAFPDEEASRALATRELERLSREHELVVLTSGTQLDEHREWVPEGPRVHDASRWVTPQDNLAVQTALVAHARTLVATYGGFSYLGPLLGIPTRALQLREPPAESRAHLQVLRAAFPRADYTVVGA